MRGALKILILVATVGLVWAPALAHADGYVAPFAGVNFHNNAGANNRGTYGVHLGWMGGGIVGGELDFGFTPSLFGRETALGTNNVWDLMGNLIVGVPVGGTHGWGVRPYGTVGFGLLRSHIEGIPSNTAEINDNDPGINAGGGVMGFFNDHVGLRGDARYFRDVHNNSTANSLKIDFGSFHYWRASIGVVFR